MPKKQIPNQLENTSWETLSCLIFYVFWLEFSHIYTKIYPKIQINILFGSTIFHTQQSIDKNNYDYNVHNC